MKNNIHADLKPILGVLLKLFPWINPKFESDFKAGFKIQQPSLVTFFLTPSFSLNVEIILTADGEKGYLTGPENLPYKGISFIPGDLTDTIGAVSFFIQEWKKTKEWNEPVFKLFHCPGDTSGTPLQGKKVYGLVAPSGKNWKAYTLTSSGIAKAALDKAWVYSKKLPYWTIRLNSISPSNCPKGIPLTLAENVGLL
jgi:hypothetical protein